MASAINAATAIAAEARGSSMALNKTMKAANMARLPFVL
jgi:hypothetical protein